MEGFSLKNDDTQFTLLLLTNVHACMKMISQHFKRPDPLSLSLLVHSAPFLLSPYSGQSFSYVYIFAENDEHLVKVQKSSKAFHY